MQHLLSVTGPFKVAPSSLTARFIHVKHPVRTADSSVTQLKPIFSLHQEISHNLGLCYFFIKDLRSVSILTFLTIDSSASFIPLRSLFPPGWRASQQSPSDKQTRQDLHDAREGSFAGWRHRQSHRSLQASRGVSRATFIWKQWLLLGRRRSGSRRLCSVF